MRILVTGASGQLGGELVARRVQFGHEVIGASHSDCDITDTTAVADALERTRPDAVINCAAWTQVDLAESHSDETYVVNAAGPENLARACAPRDIRLCHISTDYVFDGTSSTPIDEDHETHPINVYGKSKLEGERRVRSALPDNHLIVRFSWVYGHDGPNFVLTMLRIARERGELRVVADQLGSPSWTGHLAPALIRSLELGATGTLHLSSSGATSWHGFAQAIVEDAGMPHVEVRPISTAEYPTPAARPKYSVLDNRVWRDLGQQPLPEWREGLRAYLREIA